MRVLVVAPQPFFQERGTPIAVRNVLQTLCSEGHELHLLTYHEGSDVDIPGLTIIRIRRPPGVSHVPIGISWQKLVCDIFLSFRLAQLMARGRYDVVHAVEEAIFPAVLYKLFTRTRVVYDMDSLLSEQLIDKWTWLKPLRLLLQRLERFAMRKSDQILPVCEDLAVTARGCVPGDRVVLLPDVPLPEGDAREPIEPLRDHAGPEKILVLYVGNLEHYQGMDLLLDAWALLPHDLSTTLMVIGGDREHIEHYRRQAVKLGIADQVHFLGPRSLGALSRYLGQADILVSPRKLGRNTPMKLYSYMQAGKPILATQIRSHTQVLDEACSMLVEPTPAAVVAGLAKLCEDSELRRRLGELARRRVDEEYSMEAFRRRLLSAYAALS